MPDLKLPVRVEFDEQHQRPRLRDGDGLWISLADAAEIINTALNSSAQLAARLEERAQILDERDKRTTHRPALPCDLCDEISWLHTEARRLRADPPADQCGEATGKP